jgi:hypothetical protein
MSIKQEKCSVTNLSLTEVLRLRYEFEELTKGYNMPEGSDINTINWFLKDGHRSNSLRNGFNDATDIAKRIKEFNNGCTEKIRSRKQVR